MMGRKMPEPSELEVTVTVVQEDKPVIVLKCPGELPLLDFDWSLVSNNWIKKLYMNFQIIVYLYWQL